MQPLVIHVYMYFLNKTNHLMIWLSVWLACTNLLHCGCLKHCVISTERDILRPPMSFPPVCVCMYVCVRMCALSVLLRQWGVDPQFSAPLSPSVSGKPASAPLSNMTAVFSGVSQSLSLFSSFLSPGF